MCRLEILGVVLAVALLGCDQVGVVEGVGDQYTRVDVYYRSFDSLTPISYSKDDLINLAPVNLSTGDPKAIGRLNKVIPSQCREAQEPLESPLDYYLLIQFFGGDEVRKEFASSGLHFVYKSDASTKVCRLSEIDRQRLTEWIEGMPQGVDERRG